MNRKKSTVTICILSVLAAVVLLTGCPAQFDGDKASGVTINILSMSSSGSSARAAREAYNYSNCTLTAVMYNEDTDPASEIQTVTQQCSTSTAVEGLTFDAVDIGTRVSLSVIIRDNNDEDRIVAEGRTPVFTITSGENVIDLNLTVYPPYKYIVKLDAAGGFFAVKDEFGNIIEKNAITAVYIDQDPAADNFIDAEDIPAAPVKLMNDGEYTFAGWATDSAVPFKFTDEITADITVYAQWEYKSCIFIDRDDGSREKMAYSESIQIADSPVSGSFSSGAFLTGRSVDIKAFMLGKNEVTYDLWYNVKQWAQSTERTNIYTFGNAGRAGSSGELGAVPTETDKNMPVTGITWYDAAVWCNALSEMVAGNDTTAVYTVDGEVLRNSKKISAAEKAVSDNTKTGFRLPTEAEWEFAARGADPAGEGWVFEWSGAKYDTSLSTFIWYRGSGAAGTSPAGKAERLANTGGFFDMSGNVWEWTADKFDRNAANGGLSSSTGDEGVDTGKYRVMRGGSWKTSGTDFLKVSARYGSSPEIFGSNIGFRTARSGIVK